MEHMVRCRIWYTVLSQSSGSIFQDRRELSFLYRMGKASATCCSSREFDLISWLHGACAGQELQEAIKTLEEEVLKGHGDVVAICLRAW